MNNWKKNLSLAALALLIIAVLVSMNYYRIRYTVDWGRSRINDIMWRVNRTKTPATTTGSLRYSASFASITGKRGMQEVFLHCGGVLLYCGKNTKSISKNIIPEIIPYTRYYRRSHLSRDIAKLNGRGQSRSSHETVVIPGAVDTFSLSLRHRKKPEMPYVRGLYYTGYTAGSMKTFRGLSTLQQKGINAVVFDVKDIPGILSYRSSVPLARKYRLHDGSSIDNIRLFITEARRSGIYTIARIAVFRDHRLVKRIPRLSIRSKKTGGTWNRGRKELWCDPTRREVQDYAIALAVEAAAMGVDEIQFDYIRFPTVGNLRDADFAWDFGRMKKEEVIAHFLKRAWTALQPLKVRLSIDIFGVVAWGKEVDIRKTGQRIELLSRYCDCISPMLYPSHFNDNFDGHSSPADNPYYFIFNGNKKVMERIKKSGVIVRPWLQAFAWKVSHYNPPYIISQMKASHDSGARGFLFWNASNTYEKVYQALAAKKFDRSGKMAKLP